MGRIIFIVLNLFLWLITLLIAGEATVRFLRRCQSAEIDAYIAQQIRAGQALDRKYLDMHPAPGNAAAVPELPPREQFPALAPQARQALAEARNELFLECDADGHIRSLVTPAADALSPTMAGITARLADKQSLFDVLSPEQEDDARISLQNEPNQNAGFRREYWISPETGVPETLYEFVFFRSAESPPEPGVFFAAIQDGIWKTRITFKPNLRRPGLFNDPGFFTNGAGFRDYEITLPKPAGVYRIICIGGSTTFEGPRVDLTYPKMLERMLRRAFATDRIEVVNCGIIALDSVGELACVSEYLALEPDLILHYNFVNDFYGRMMSVTYPTPPHNGLADCLKWRLKTSELVFYHAPHLYLPNDAAWLDNLRFVTISNLRSLGRAAREYGADVALCSFASPNVDGASRLEKGYFDKRIAMNIGKPWVTASQYTRYARLYAGELKRLCEEEGWTYVPVAEQFTAGSESFHDICHLYCPGIERKAGLIFEGIRDIVAEALSS